MKTRPIRWPALGVLACAVLFGTAARADEVIVAVAANFAGALTALSDGFTQATGHVIKASAGPTGRFFVQITQGGAPFEVLLAADTKTPQRLVDSGHAQAGSRFTYAVGQLVLWSAQPGLVDDQGQVLAGGRFAHLAIANPKLAPYGQAAMEVLAARGVLEALRPRLVTGDTVAQAYQFVRSGNAELGFVALSLVAAPGQAAAGSTWHVPQALYQPIRQDAVLLQAGATRPAARALLDYLKTPAARAVIARFGYRS
jgi:molybdate transport system substrate-binding protein